MKTRAQIIREAVQAAIREQRCSHDYWYYTMEPIQHGLFTNFREFEARADHAYKKELERMERDEELKSASAEAYWQAKQGDEYGSF